MENSVIKLSSTKIYKKSRSFNLQTLHKYSSFKEGSSKSKSLAGDEGEDEKKRKRKKEVPLSSFQQLDKKSRRGFDELYNGKLSSSPRNDNLQQNLSHKLNCNSRSSLEINGKVVNIPKRRRGSFGRKKFESNQVLEPLGLPRAEAVSSGNTIVKLNVEYRKIKDNQVVESSRSSCSKTNSADRLDKGNGDPVSTFRSSNTSPASYRKRKRSHGKKKYLASGSESVAENVISSVDNLIKISGDIPEDDEENLEQNAARMLSSRFDPSCTGGPKSKSSASTSAQDVSFLCSRQYFTDQRRNSYNDLEFASVDTGIRVLRPRKQSKVSSLLRRRRRFYEILTKDLDVYWVLNRRIKIFWPLDESWYYGLVNDYDPERELHHIRYDDCDEEWINLQNERFKLLLLSSEIPDKTDAKRHSINDDDAVKNKDDLIRGDDGFLGSHMESEPIISWLARSSRRAKSSSTGIMKKQKTSRVSPCFVPELLPDITEKAYVASNVGPSERANDKPLLRSALLDGLPDADNGMRSVLKRTTSSRGSKISVVYYRRRFRKKGDGLSHMSEENNLREHAALHATSLAFDIKSSQVLKENDISCRCLDPGELWRSTDNGCLIKLTILLHELKEHRFELTFLLAPVLKYIFGVENFQLLNSFLLLHYGTVSQTWPMVLLEILFVDNVMGLRLLSFEGSLKQGIDFVLLVYNLFHQHHEGKYVHLPVTSIRFKLSFFQDPIKQYVFTCYCFSQVKSSKWLYLDHKLQHHCSLARQLPLSECTFDNIQAFEGGRNLLQTFSDSKYPSASKGKLPPFAHSFAVAPTSFRSLHLKLLMDHTVACISFHDNDTKCMVEHSENSCRLISDDSTLADDCWENVSEITPTGNIGTSLGGTCSLREDDRHVKTSWSSKDVHINVDKTSDCFKHSGQSDSAVFLQSCNVVDSEQFGTTSHPLGPSNHVLQNMSLSQCDSDMNSMCTEISSFDQVERPAVLMRTNSGQLSADLAWNISDDIVGSPNPVGPRSIWHRSRSSLNASSFGKFSNQFPDKKAAFIGNGPKKPRTQVQYTVPFGGFDNGSKHKVHEQKGISYTRNMIANEKRSLDGTRRSKRNLELACDANVLTTLGDRGWRECGARVFLELADRNEWRLAVKFSGTTKYSYKVSHVLQPGTTNRYTHAMMWKGEKDWALEFPDRSQWMLFKEMHEECYNQNIRATFIKNIPIPGVRLIEEVDDNGAEGPSFHCSPNYFQQVETDVDMVKNSTRNFYDMDSDDEQWVLEHMKHLDTHESKGEDMSEELFEKIMNTLEKTAYARQCDHFTSAELEEHMVGVGPMEVIKVVHEHWWQKRQRKGMPLIRHFQAPLWGKYQQEVKEWELAITNGTPPVEKPPMFAFCLRPRGLELPYKGSKQRSLRKLSVSCHSHAIMGYQDGGVIHAYGNSPESSDGSPVNQTCRVFSPRDAGGGPRYLSLSGGDGSEWSRRPNLHRNKSKKFRTPNNGRNQKDNKFDGVEMLDGSDLDEFRLRDASGAARHALNMAKLKREKSRRLLYRADLAINKAVVALMTAEAIKASFVDSSKDE